MRIVGIMTGTSLDCVDVAVVEFFETSKFTLLASGAIPINAEFREKILAICNFTTTIKEVSQANFYLSHLYEQAVNAVLDANGIPISTIDAVAIHGQTIWHNPTAEEYAGVAIASTLQLGCGSVLSALLQKTVVSDFRSADIAIGGQGAPLVPIFDYYFLRDTAIYTIALNIGGIANITAIPPNATINNIMAYDTGAGNMLIDAYMQQFYQKDYDNDGEIAMSGVVNADMLYGLLALPYYQQPPPKSCGRELFNAEYVSAVLPANIPKCDIIRTLTELTTMTISTEINKLTSAGRVIVKGGGVNNTCMMQLLRQYIAKDIEILNSDAIGISSKYYEAIAFAFLGYLTLSDVAGNVPNVTGASQSIVLGSISRNYKR
ncbi:MAG: anhydro-N-acetylmuramic acid kinase [Ignavibacteria bacterium]|jgi:anhydro-N-acetylmuramic acid kinase|nr:anhydro-N-acetylmuramic acid kinase [Ignavibacteria bacterium]